MAAEKRRLPFVRFAYHTGDFGTLAPQGRRGRAESELQLALSGLAHLPSCTQGLRPGLHLAPLRGFFASSGETPHISLAGYCDYYGGSIPFRMIGDPFLHAYN
jgi:hypothetical protein